MRIRSLCSDLVLGAWCLVLGAWCLVRRPSTEHQDPGPRTYVGAPFAYAKYRNSSRVLGSSRKPPRSALVIVFEFCFSTPRIIMHRWNASITTPTPAGFSTSSIALGDLLGQSLLHLEASREHLDDARQLATGRRYGRSGCRRRAPFRRRGACGARKASTARCRAPSPCSDDPRPSNTPVAHDLRHVHVISAREPEQALGDPRRRLSQSLARRDPRR